MGSFLVIGMGRFGSSVAVELHRMKHDVLVIDEQEDNIAQVINQVTDGIIGNTTDESVLRSLDIYSFDCVIVALAGTIEDSILTTIQLKELGAKLIVCKAQNERHAKILSQLGADKVIRPEYDMGIRVAHSLARRNIIDYLEISSDYGVIEIFTPKHWVNKTIMKNNLRKKYGITIIAIRGAGIDKVKISPTADEILHEGDILTVIGFKQDLEAISALK